MSKMYRLIDDIRLKRKLWLLSLTLILLTVSACATFVLWIDSNKLIVMGQAHLQSIIAENQQAIELNVESVDGIAAIFKALMGRIEKIPEKPHCASRNAILFLVATRKKEYEKNAAASASEYETAVAKYTNGVKDLYDKKKKVDSLIVKLDDVRKFLLSGQYSDTIKKLHEEIGAFRSVCEQCFISRMKYNWRMRQLSSAVEKARSVLSSPTIRDFEKMLSRHKEIADGLKDRIESIELSERVALSAEEKLRKMPYDAHNAETMWIGQMSATTNNIMTTFRDVLQELTTSRIKCVKTLDSVRSVLKQTNIEVNILGERYPDCVEISEVESIQELSGRIDEFQTAMDEAVASCRSSMNDLSEKTMREIEGLNFKAEKLSKGTSCAEKEWIVLFDGIGSLKTPCVTSYLAIATKRLKEIEDDARNLEKRTKNEANRIQSLVLGKWNMRVEKLYDVQLAKQKEVEVAISGATTRLNEKPSSEDDGYSYLRRQLDIFRERSDTAKGRLDMLKRSFPKDGTTVGKFKSELVAIGNEMKDVLELLNAWNLKLDEAIDRAKPRIRLAAELNGIEKRAKVTGGIKGSGYVTPIDGIESVVGRRIFFSVEYTEDGVKYIGARDYVVKAGSQTVVIDLRPEFTLPYDFRFCGNCGNSLERHRHVRYCPYCHAELKR